MHTNSFPPTDRDELPEGTKTASFADVLKGGPIPVRDAVTKTYPCNTTLRDKLRALRESSRRYSNANLGDKLGVSDAIISQYLNVEGNKYSAPVAGLERKAAALIDAIERRRATGIETAPCDVTTQMLAAFANILETNDLGAIIAESGEGKTRGTELILQKDSRTKLIRVTEWNRSIHDLEDAMWTAAALSGWDGRCKRFPYFIEKMTGTDIPFLFDDAHKASKDGLCLIATFQEITQCPVALLGVSTLIDKIDSDLTGQLPSRIGIKWVIPSGSKDEANILHMVRSIAKDANGELDDLVTLALQVAKETGHKRAVQKQLNLARRARHLDPKLTWTAAFRQVHTQLHRKYPLT